MIIIHGYGHSGYLLNLGLELAKENIEAILFDMNGFGYSGGRRFNPNANDIFNTFKDVFLTKRKYPVFVFAEGYGATLFMQFQILYNLKISGLIISCPWINMPFQSDLNR